MEHQIISMSRINYKKFVEDFAFTHYGCMCCRKQNCGDLCQFECDFELLIQWINDSPHVDEEQQLDIKNYII